MGRNIPAAVLKYINTLLSKMKLELNSEKSYLLNGYKESFDFLGFTFRYSKGIFGRNLKYWNIEASSKSQNKIKANIRKYLKSNGHKAPVVVAKDLNAMDKLFFY